MSALKKSLIFHLTPLHHNIFELAQTIFHWNWIRILKNSRVLWSSNFFSPKISMYQNLSLYYYCYYHIYHLIMINMIKRNVIFFSIYSRLFSFIIVRYNANSIIILKILENLDPSKTIFLHLCYNRTLFFFLNKETPSKIY